MKVYFIGTGPGDPELIAVKGKRIIESSGYCIVADILKPSYGNNCPVAIVYKASWKDEKVITSSLSKVVDATIKNDIKRTAMIIVGSVLSRDFEYSKLYNKHLNTHIEKNHEVNFKQHFRR